jgi:hypothetical protein
LGGKNSNENIGFWDWKEFTIRMMLLKMPGKALSVKSGRLRNGSKGRLGETGCEHGGKVSEICPVERGRVGKRGNLEAFFEWHSIAMARDPAAYAREVTIFAGPKLFEFARLCIRDKPEKRFGSQGNYVLAAPDATEELLQIGSE